MVRQPAGGPLSLPTTSAYDDLGNLTFSENPENEATSWVYNAASEMVSQTDPLTETTSYEWELGRQVAVIDPFTRSTESEYDLARRLIEVRTYDDDDNELTNTGFGYDEAGNRTVVMYPRGFDEGATNGLLANSLTFPASRRL